MKLIKLKHDHFVIVDDSEIKEGDFVYDSKDKVIRFVKRYLKDDWIKKITHSTQPLYKNDFWAIQELKLSEVKELIGEVDVEKKADDIIPNLLHKKYVKTGFIAGYNQALEDNKKRKYTEEDLRMAYKEGAKSQRFNAYLDGSEKTIDETIQSLQLKTEWEVEIVDGKLKLKL